eukprot:scaffold3126_cov136-Amphora_coffeaeformis.AAC.5
MNGRQQSDFKGILEFGNTVGILIRIRHPTHGAYIFVRFQGAYSRSLGQPVGQGLFFWFPPALFGHRFNRRPGQNGFHGAILQEGHFGIRGSFLRMVFHASKHTGPPLGFTQLEHQVLAPVLGWNAEDAEIVLENGGGERLGAFVGIPFQLFQNVARFHSRMLPPRGSA